MKVSKIFIRGVAVLALLAFCAAPAFAQRVPTYHIADPGGLVSGDLIRHKAVGQASETTTAGWLPAGEVTIGLTSGASTPDNLVGAAIRRLEELGA